MTKRLDEKLERIRRDPGGAKDFIIADAKDADMAFGVAAPGPARDEKTGEALNRWKTLEEFRQQIRDIIEQDIVDVMLLSASNVEQLAIREGLFTGSAITPAARANDTTDIWVVRGGCYPKQPSRPFRSATIDHIKYGHLEDDHSRPVSGADLGLYSMTFANDLEHDLKTLEAFQAFRVEAEKKRFRYFLEVFNPNVDTGLEPEKVGAFLNDHIARCLAGVTEAGRPLFLKIPYNGPEAMEELVAYDPNLVVGILGGSAGTTLDAFQLIHDAKKHGARVSLFGRKINLSEHPLSFIECLRHVADEEMTPKDAVKKYHDALERLGIAPLRALADDLELTDNNLRYG